MSDPDGPAGAAPGPLIERELGRIVSSALFKGSPRHRHMLRHLVEHVVAGETRALKESVLALELFDRTARPYDPGRDTIVRVEARRLRQRLARWYEGGQQLAAAHRAAGGQLRPHDQAA